MTSVNCGLYVDIPSKKVVFPKPIKKGFEPLETTTGLAGEVLPGPWCDFFGLAELIQNVWSPIKNISWLIQNVLCAFWMQGERNGKSKLC